VSYLQGAQSSEFLTVTAVFVCVFARSGEHFVSRQTADRSQRQIARTFDIVKESTGSQVLNASHRGQNPDGSVGPTS
jgi:hypothetical protein